MVALSTPFKIDAVPLPSGNIYVALRYADAGMPVFPCDHRPDPRKPGAPSKAPLVKWKEEATVNREQIIEWWTANPNALVGLPMGADAWCADCDRHGGGTDGVAAFAQLIKDNGGVFPDPVPYSHTINDGQHFFFAMPADFTPTNSRGRLPPGIDVRGLGGYVIAPGSECAFGGWRETGAKLSDMVEAGEVPPAPEWLLELIRPAAPKLSEQAAATAPISYRNQEQRVHLDEESVFEAISLVSAEDRETWMKFGAALHDTGQPWAREMWDAWSRTSQKFNAYKQEEAWRSFGRPYNGSRATVASIFHAAKQYGYRPRSKFDELPAWDGVTRGPGFAHPKMLEAVANAIPPAPGFRFVAYPWPDPAKLPRRKWVYGNHLIRGFISVTVAPGGVGKSSLTMVEALAMAANRPLLGIAPAERQALNVAIWNGEDPLDELDKRMAAICTHYQIDRHECAGQLFLSSGRDQPIVIAEHVKNDLVVAKPMVEAVKAAIVANKIDVLIVDPFVSSHRVSENDNMAIDVVAKQWANIANETGCAIDLVHHTRKGNGNEPAGVEAARGASSLISAARSVRTLNPMSEEQADVLGVPIKERRRYFNITYGKSSMSAASDDIEWRQLVSVGLGNFEPGFDEDHVGVVALWTPSSADDQVTTDQLREIQRKISEGEWRENPQSTLWAGNAIAAVLGLDVAEKAARARVKKHLEGWIKGGLLAIEEKRDEARRMRKFVVMGRSIDFYNPRA